MVQSWVTLLVAILYISILFAVASYGDRTRGHTSRFSKGKPNIYAFSLAIYCTTWTFFGSVGLASTSGISFLAIYIGPILMVTLGYPLIKRVIQLSKGERITSVADFLGSRYGKNNKVAATAVIIAVIGTIPYIALQLKAISRSVNVLVTEFSNGFPSGLTPIGDITVFVALTLAVFAILFGTRHADATEHQHGLMLAIALESVIKLIAFISVGAFVVWGMFGGIGELFEKAAANDAVRQMVSNGLDTGHFLTLTFLSLAVFVLLPRQFHVAVVESTSERELERARWLFPAYLVAINLFVIPIAIAGTLRFGIVANPDDYVLLLPLVEEQRALGLLVFIGGLSAGTAMVVVASVALAIMISNDLVLPMILRSRATFGRLEPLDMEARLLKIRRTAICGVLGLAFLYYAAADNTAALASIGLVSFTAIAQLAPSFFLGLFWKQANSRGAMAGMISGFVVWTYCLLVPTLLPDTNSFVANGPFGIATLRPENLFDTGLNPLQNGVFWSLAVNAFFFVAGSISRESEPQERMQAALFTGYQGTRHWSTNSNMPQIRLQTLKETLARYLGTKRTNRSFEAHFRDAGIDETPEMLVDESILRFSEQLLASAVGASSSRLIHTLLIQRKERTDLKDLQLLDEASRAILFNRDMLQTAFNQLEQGVTVFDADYRLASWNRQFRRILNLPTEMGQAGLPIRDVCDAIADANALVQAGYPGHSIAEKLTAGEPAWQLRLPGSDKVLEISTSQMPDGGIVVTWHDITERVRAAEALSEANETLERRVEERTRELEEAKQLADQANASKTRFLAAAGHDIVQPINAARLYVATLLEKTTDGKNLELTENIGKSLGSVEEILGSILAISRLDTANPDVNVSSFPLNRITEQLEIEFEPQALKAGLALRFVHSRKWVRSDPALLRRLLQNLISNALKFTPEGKILVGCRVEGDRLEFQVHDTGVGMSEDDQKLVFREFTRLNTPGDHIPGLGLGLSIVERISTLLGHPVSLTSAPGRGTRFSVMLERVEALEDQSRETLRRGSQRVTKLTGLKVLCVDNEPAILSGMDALLSQWGCEVRGASNRKEALRQLDESGFRPDLILVDYHLDKTTGITVYRELNETTGSSVPGVLITADRSEEVKKEANDNGLHFLNKPVKPAALRALLSQQGMTSTAAE